MKKIFLYLPLLFLSLSMFAHATTSKSSNLSEAYTNCKRRASVHREKIMYEARQSYRLKSDAVTLKTKEDLKTISWLINISYRTEIMKILNNQSSQMSSITDEINKARLEANTTEKAEKSLCDIIHKK